MLQQHSICSGCGLLILSDNSEFATDFNASSACRECCYQLSYYTLSLQDVYFIHQLVVDTYAAQHSGPQVKPITTVFALVGLYLVNEKQFTGKSVQDVHQQIADANPTKIWPRFFVPKEKATRTVQDVLDVSDTQKSELIHTWCGAVWQIWKSEEEAIIKFLEKYVKDF